MLRKCLFVSAGLLALGILAISIFTFLIFDDKDRCLDYGGRYNDKTQQCEQK
ncbi:hypothetical protein JFL47_10715 [Haemophilus haemoglobinophilus]|nr:hypothetical protein [Canicola haemoglobinophilus]